MKERSFFYIIFGILSSLIGWSFSQILYTVLPRIVGVVLQEDYRTLSITPELIIFPAVAICVTVSMVSTELLMSNPVHEESKQRIFNSFRLEAAFWGFGIGISAAILSIILVLIRLPSPLVRILSWGLIGLGVGISGGLLWFRRSRQRRTRLADERIRVSAQWGAAAGATAAILLELMRLPLSSNAFAQVEDPIGFTIMGMLLGVATIFSTSPAYQVALRAVEGFEAIHPQYIDPDAPSAWVNSRHIRLYPNFNNGNAIEEGISLELSGVARGELELFIGSAEDSELCIPHIPTTAASLTIRNREVTLKCLYERRVEVQDNRLHINMTRLLTHNQLITLYHENDPSKYYRFVFYDRFLDPEA